MKTPSKVTLKKSIDFTQSKILNPIVENLKFSKICDKFQDFATAFYKICDDTTDMMLIFEALSLATSSFAQIISLQKSNRENKDYLIEQEINEFLVSLPLTVGLPYVATKAIGRQIASGKIMTASSRELIEEVIKPYLGAKAQEGFYVAPKIPLREKCEIYLNKALLKIQKTKAVPKKIRTKIKIKNINPNRSVPLAEIRDLVWDFDQKVFNELKEKNLSDMRELEYFKSPNVKQIMERAGAFQGNSAYSHIYGELEGIKLALLLGLSILAGNVIMPMIKNHLTNNRYRKELEKIGETPESIERKKRYGNLKTYEELNQKTNVFDVFSNSDNTITKKPIEITQNQDRYKNLLKPPQEDNTFKNINTFSSLTTQSNRLRI